MAVSERPRTRTASRSTRDTARATHAFEITGYSLHKGLGVGKFILSAPFDVGGYDWHILYYPDGNRGQDGRGYFSVCLVLKSEATGVRALYDFRLVDQATGLSSLMFSTATPKVFSTRVNEFTGVVENTYYGRFMNKSDLEASSYLRDDRLVIECDLTVIKQAQVVEIAMTPEAEVPPSNLSDNLGKLLLDAAEGMDVTFKVEGEAFPAHKIVLAVRSPVFRAELYGPIGDNKREYITIEDMQPAVFRALLHFIYTDSLPAMSDLDGDERKEMIKHLLVAADRYAMERLKLICEGILCKSLDVESVATTLALADQHNCSNLKDACVEYMNSSNRLEDVVATKGYVHLKRACPAVFVDMWEKATKSRKIYYADPGLSTE